MNLSQILQERVNSDNLTILQIDSDGYVPTGVSFAGNIYDRSYYDLIQVFGKPKKSDGEDKVQVYWGISIDYQKDDGDQDTVMFTIYDWKEDKRPGDVTQWNIGARKTDATIVSDLLDIVLEK